MPYFWDVTPFSTAIILNDGVLLQWGTDGDVVSTLRASAILVDEGDDDLPALFKGAANHPPIAADSLLVANTTSDGGIGLIVNDGGDSRMPVWLEGSTGRVLVSNGADAPLPKSLLHLWAGDSDQATAHALARLVLEDDDDTFIHFLTPNTDGGGLIWGDPEDNDTAIFSYDHANARYRWRLGGGDEIYYSTGALAFQQATTISTAEGDLILNPTGDVDIGSNLLQMSQALLKGQAGTGLAVRSTADDAYSGLILSLLRVTTNIEFTANAGTFDAENADANYFALRARDTGVGLVNVARAVGAADAYFEATLGIVLAPVAQWGAPVEGAVIYNSVTNKLNFYNGSTWEVVTSE